jgi:peptidyl-prolyl cis-trans isomerase B (cyclophilin B)
MFAKTLRRVGFLFVVATLAALLCAQGAEAAKEPRITNKVYFDIKQGDKSLGRST